MRSTALAEARGELAKVLAEPALTEALAELAEAFSRLEARLAGIQPRPDSMNDRRSVLEAASGVYQLSRDPPADERAAPTRRHGG